MRTTIKGKNLDVPAHDRSYASTKLARLERLLGDRSEALVELSTENHSSADTSHIVEATVSVDGRIVRGHAAAATHRAAIDEVVDKLERRAVSLKDRPLVRRRTAARRHALGTADTAPDDEPEAGPRIVKTKRFAIEPMFEEDAVAQMEELGHSFFLFVNAASERLAILYRRRDGNYGLIEPSLGGEYTPRDASRRGRNSAGG